MSVLLLVTSCARCSECNPLVYSTYYTLKDGELTFRHLLGHVGAGSRSALCSRALYTLSTVRRHYISIHHSQSAVSQFLYIQQSKNAVGSVSAFFFSISKRRVDNEMYCLSILTCPKIADLQFRNRTNENANEKTSERKR